MVDGALSFPLLWKDQALTLGDGRQGRNV